MKTIDQQDLSKRERQIMNVLYQLGKASVKDVRSNISQPPSYSAVRAFLNILERKGFVAHEQEGIKYVYSPTIPTNRAMKVEFKQLLKTFFEGSVESAVAALIDIKDRQIDFNKLESLIQKAKSEQKK